MFVAVKNFLTLTPFLNFNTGVLRFVCPHKTYDFFALLETSFFSVLWRLILLVSLPLDSNAVSKLCLHPSALGLSPSTFFFLYPCFLHSPLVYSLFTPLGPSLFLSYNDTDSLRPQLCIGQAVDNGRFQRHTVHISVS